MLTKIYLRLSGDYVSPRYERRSDIVNNFAEENIVYDRLYSFKEEKAMTSFSEKGLFSIPFIQIYDRDKDLLSMVSGEQCSWKLLSSVLHSDSLQVAVADTGMYNTVMQYISPLDIKADTDTFQYYVFAGWVNYLPKMKENLFLQTKAIKDSLQNNVCLSYINLDMLEGWEDNSH